jgi:hypothetical protein
MVDVLRGERANVGVLRILRGFLEHLDVFLMLIDHVLDELLIEIAAGFLAEAFVGAVVITVFVDLYVFLARDGLQLACDHLVIVHEFLGEALHIGVGGFFRREFGECDFIRAAIRGLRHETTVAPAQLVGSGRTSGGRAGAGGGRRGGARIDVGAAGA